MSYIWWNCIWIGWSIYLQLIKTYPLLSVIVIFRYNWMSTDPVTWWTFMWSHDCCGHNLCWPNRYMSLVTSFVEVLQVDFWRSIFGSQKIGQGFIRCLNLSPIRCHVMTYWGCKNHFSMLQKVTGSSMWVLTEKTNKLTDDSCYPFRHIYCRQNPHKLHPQYPW